MRLQNSLILSIIEYFIENEFLYIITEFASGGTLEKRLQSIEKKKLSQDEAFRYFVMLCIGLYTIHEQGLTHGDINTTNLLLKPCENGHDLLLINTSSFKRSQKEDRMDNISWLYYKAPENIKVHPDKPSPKLDSWAAGVIFYEMLAGRLPFQSQS